MHAGAAVGGVPLLPGLERTQCRERRVDRAMAQAIAGEALPCCILVGGDLTPPSCCAACLACRRAASSSALRPWGPRIQDVITKWICTLWPHLCRSKPGSSAYCMPGETQVPLPCQ